jgi:hypothetical protein
VRKWFHRHEKVEKDMDYERHTAACPCRRVNPAFSERLSMVRGPISHTIMGAQEDTQAGSADPKAS